MVLPPWSEEDPPEVDVQDRNAFIVLVNSRDQLLVEDELTEIEDLKRKAKEFIDNRGRDPRLSDSPQKAVISFKGNRGTSYERYIEVYNELWAAYNELRNEYANRNFGSTVPELEEENDTIAIKEIRDEYPIRISEAEPTGGG